MFKKHLLTLFLFSSISMFLFSCSPGCKEYSGDLSGESGYKDYRMSDDQFCITYFGSKNDSAPIYVLLGDSGKKAIRTYALKRCSEITKSHGFNYFFIISEDWKTVPGGSFPECRTVTLKIKCYKDNPPQGAMRVR